jgi:hypothetical protein
MNNRARIVTLLSRALRAERSTYEFSYNRSVLARGYGTSTHEGAQIASTALSAYNPKAISSGIIHLSICF